MVKPDVNDELPSGYMKQFTGNDKFFARSFYEKKLKLNKSEYLPRLAIIKSPMNTFINIDVVTEAPIGQVTKCGKNIFRDFDPEHCHSPSDKLSTLNEYYQTFEGTDKELAQEVVDLTAKYIYAQIYYPLTNNATVRFECNQPITYGMLLYAHTYAYQLVYKLEDEDVGKPTGNMSQFCLNRATSNGRFGIWGHTIDDLIYNGYSEFKVFNDAIVCQFDCDS